MTYINYGFQDYDRGVDQELQTPTLGEVKDSLGWWQDKMEMFVNWGELIMSVLIAITVLVVFIYLFSKVRKRILFIPWTNRFDDDLELSKSISDLLLFKLRYIKQTHKTSDKTLELWNTFGEIPSFRQSFEKEIGLLGTIELGVYGKALSGLLTFLFKLIPLFIRPAALNGTISRFGEKRTILHVSLDNYRPRKWFRNKKRHRIWEKEVDDLTKEQIPDVIEEMAYKIYIDLTGGERFKSWHCFKYFTKGLRCYLNYRELGDPSNLNNAEMYYAKALEYEKNNPVVSYNLGVLKYYQFTTGLNEEAIDSFKKAMNCTDINLRSQALCGLANSYAKKYGGYKSFDMESLDGLRQALDYAYKAALINDKLDAAYKSLAYAHHKYGEALDYLCGQLKDKMSNPKERSTKHKMSAHKYYKKAIKINRKHFMAHNYLAKMYVEWAKRLPKKDTPFLKLCFLHTKAFLNRELLLDRTYLLQKTIHHAEEALKINPSYSFAFDNLGNAYCELGQFEKARESYRNAILYRPTYAEAMNDLAMIYLERDFQEFDVFKAKSLHELSVNVLDPEEEQERKDKLRTKFLRRAKELNISLNDLQTDQIVPDPS